MYEYHFQILFEGGYVFGESWWWLLRSDPKFIKNTKDGFSFD
jgi:hypothetical protein